MANPPAPPAGAGGGTAVLDASPMILFATIGRFDLLRHAAVAVIAPAGAVGEAAVRDHVHGAATLARSSTWLQIVDVPVLAPAATGGRLGRGESEVLTHVLVDPAARLAVLDDLDARVRAIALRLRLTGSVGVVLRARQAGAVPAAKPIVRELLAAGLSVADHVLVRGLATVGETFP